MTYKVCAECGKTFLAKNKKRIYCDTCAIERHRQQARERQNKERKLYDFVCPICGRAFQSHHVAAKYCSIECATEARRRSNPYVQKPKVKEKPKRMGNDLAKIVAEADRLGMTYGQYVAQYEARK